MSAQPKPTKVLIAGAGIAGLVAGLALLQRGIEVEIFEQAAELRELGAGVQLSANGTRRADRARASSGNAGDRCEPSGKQIRLFSTGRTWKLFDLGVSSRALYGAPYWMVHRGDFHRVLLRCVQRPRAGPAASRCPLRRTSTKTAAASGFDLANGEHASRRRGGRRRRRSFRNPRRQIGGDRKPFFAGVAAWRGLVPMERLPPTMQRDIGTNWVGPGRPCHHLSGSPRRAAEFRRHFRGRELAGGILDRARHARGLQPLDSRAGIRRSTPSSKTSTCPTNGRCSAASRWIASSRDAPA